MNGTRLLRELIIIYSINLGYVYMEITGLKLNVDILYNKTVKRTTILTQYGRISCDGSVYTLQTKVTSSIPKKKKNKRFIPLYYTPPLVNTLFNTRFYYAYSVYGKSLGTDYGCRW